MTAKQYLGQIRKIDQCIESKIEQLAVLRSQAVKATAVISDTPRSGNGQSDPVGGVVAQMVDLQGELGSTIQDLMETKQQAMRLIDRVPTAEHRVVLQQRYLCGKAWEDIADEMCYSVRWITTLHGRAIRGFEKEFLLVPISSL